jgi:hypothetical protein
VVPAELEPAEPLALTESFGARIVSGCLYVVFAPALFAVTDTSPLNAPG